MNKLCLSICPFRQKFNNLSSAAFSHLCRSYMYVPGDKSKMIDKIISLSDSESPDISVFDIEDGVDLKNKHLARSNIFSLIESEKLKLSPHISACVRINSIAFKELFDKDLDMIVECLKVSNYQYPRMINLPKVENDNDLALLDHALKSKIDSSKLKNPIELVILIESCLAISKLDHLCQHFTSTNYSCLRVNHAVFGSDDYCASMGVSRTGTNVEVLYARQKFANVVKAYKIAPIDMVDIDIHNLEALEENCQFGATIGYVGKQVIHPKQLPVVNKCFSPAAESVKWASDLLQEYELQKLRNIGAFVFKGRMIDMPTILVAQNIVQRNILINKKK